MTGFAPKKAGKSMISVVPAGSLGSARTTHQIASLFSYLSGTIDASRRLVRPAYLTVRHSVWQFLRRVPVEYEHLDPRGNVKLSTKIKVAADRKGIKAGQIAARMNETLEAYWPRARREEDRRGQADLSRRGDRCPERKGKADCVRG